VISSSRLIAGLVVIGMLGAAVVGLQMERERRFASVEPAQQILYVSSPAVLTRMALSYDALLADLYWIRAIQYYGGRRLSAEPDKNYDLLFPMLDLTTSLDQDFTIAYRFGAFFLSERAPGGAGRSDLAIELLNKAMQRRPDRWEYPHDVGFVHYRNGEYKQAAEWFERAAAIPGAAEWRSPRAAVTLAPGGGTAAARGLW
jgi:tetratricopeptide (TPR) repeat protein